MPWRLCGSCEVVWAGWDPCWCCGEPGRLTTPPQPQTYATVR